MAKVSTNINLDQELKRNAQELFNALGMDLTTAVTIFLKQAVRAQAIPFEIKRETVNSETMAAVGEYYDMLNNLAEYKRYSSFAEAMEDVLDEV